MVSHRFLLSQTASRPILGAVVVSKPSAFPIGEPVPRRWTRRTLRDAAGTQAPPKVQRTGVPRSCQQAARKRWRLAHLPARCDVRSAPAAPLVATGPAGCGAALSQSFDPEPDFGEADADNPLLDRHDNHRRPAILVIACGLCSRARSTTSLNRALAWVTDQTAASSEMVASSASDRSVKPRPCSPSGRGFSHARIRTGSR